THRQRTQNYIKALESEVIRLRASEGDLMQENKKLQSQNDSLLSSLNSANIPLPAGFEGSLETAQPGDINFDMPATVSYRMDDLDHQRLHIDWPPTSASTWQTSQAHAKSPATTFDSSWDQSGAKPLPGLPQTHGRTPLFFCSHKNYHSDNILDLSLSSLSFSPTYQHPAPASIPGALDSAEVAIDFVLALEHPCMPHIPHPSNPSSEDPSNHALMMSAPLMCRSPRPPQPDSSWSANGSILRQLLNLSSTINLDGEITPVEAWHRIRQHPRFSSVDRYALEQIKADLSSIVRCCGFGAVLDEEAFQFTLESRLGPV
ncbi:MAG: hypothetical protein Q9183_005177, partial [Haloplaca sp. 2 TL-2023]